MKSAFDSKATQQPRGTNRLAIAALATAVAGIPLFRLVTGVVAIALGAIALGTIRESRQKGIGLAAAGVLLGLVDVVGWLIVLSIVFHHGFAGTDLRFAQAPPDAATVRKYLRNRARDAGQRPD